MASCSFLRLHVLLLLNIQSPKCLKVFLCWVSQFVGVIYAYTGCEMMGTIIETLNVKVHVFPVVSFIAFFFFLKQTIRLSCLKDLKLNTSLHSQQVCNWSIAVWQRCILGSVGWWLLCTMQCMPFLLCNSHKQCTPCKGNLHCLHRIEPILLLKLDCPSSKQFLRNVCESCSVGTYMSVNYKIDPFTLFPYHLLHFCWVLMYRILYI